MKEIEGHPDREKILNVLKEPEPKGRERLGLDPALMEKLAVADPDKVEPSTIRVVMLRICRVLMNVSQTPRGLEIVMLTCQGKSSREIAKELGLSKNTVLAKLRQIRKEHPAIGKALGVQSRECRYPGGKVVA